jgi:hypothetical protein
VLGCPLPSNGVFRRCVGSVPPVSARGFTRIPHVADWRALLYTVNAPIFPSSLLPRDCLHLSTLSLSFTLSVASPKVGVPVPIVFLWNPHPLSLSLSLSLSLHPCPLCALVGPQSLHARLLLSCSFLFLHSWRPLFFPSFCFVSSILKNAWLLLSCSFLFVVSILWIW